jgi:hypothetical protein
VKPSRESVAPTRTYTIALTIAIILFLGTLTAVIVLIMISNAREQEREDEFEVTLTSVFADVSQTQTALAITPVAPPAVVLGEYFFERAEPPSYAAAPACTSQVVTGRVLDQDEQPTDGFQVLVWGDFAPTRTLLTGEVVGQDKGQWWLAFGDMINRRVWVQIVVGERHFSAPVEIVFDEADCAHNLAEVVFRQIAPLE